MRKTFPKEGEKKKNETIQKLRGRIKYLEKKVKFLENELINVVKPVRRDPKLEEPTGNVEKSKEEWRKEFLKKFRQSLKERK